MFELECFLSRIKWKQTPRRKARDQSRERGVGDRIQENCISLLVEKGDLCRKNNFLKLKL